MSPAIIIIPENEIKTVANNIDATTVKNRDGSL
jgi:hypothetical protein